MAPGRADGMGPTFPGMPTGIERIATLEAEMRATREKLEEIAASQKVIESLLLQGRGAVRIVHWALGGLAVFGAGWAGHTKLSEILKWMGG